MNVCVEMSVRVMRLNVWMHVCACVRMCACACMLKFSCIHLAAVDTFSESDALESTKTQRIF